MVKISICIPIVKDSSKPNCPYIVLSSVSERCLLWLNSTNLGIIEGIRFLSLGYRFTVFEQSNKSEKQDFKSIRPQKKK
jgi:hypothetical protein